MCKIKPVAIIVAMAKNRVIGCEGKIPWDIPEDRRHFQRLTMGHVVVMGRRTYEEIGHPLPGRFTYLISSTLTVETEHCHTVRTLSEVLKREKKREIFICGGAQLYREALPFAKRLYLTEVKWEEAGDTFFPDVPKDQFREIARTKGMGAYDFVTYERLENYYSHRDRFVVE